MAPCSSTLAWKIPWMEEPGGLQAMGSRRVGHDWETSLSLFTFMHWRRKWQPTPVFLPGESQGRGSLVGVYGVAQSRTRLKRLSSSSSIHFSLIFESQNICQALSRGWSYLILPELVDLLIWKQLMFNVCSAPESFLIYFLVISLPTPTLFSFSEILVQSFITYL